MGNPKQKWTSEEEEALKAGVSKYGVGKWKFIQKDPEFNQFLHSRSNIDLKDKWRNMNAAVGSKERFKTPKVKPTQDAPAAPSVNIHQTPAAAVAVARDTPADQVKDEPAKELPDSKNGPRYQNMIFEVLGATKEPNGLEITSILNYIEQRTEVPHNFRKQLASKLRRLVQQERLEKVDSCYRLKEKNSLSKDSNNNGWRDSWPGQALSTSQTKTGASLEEAAKTAAYKVVEAENNSLLAAAAVKELELVSKLAEETDSILQLANDILERCSRGEVVLVA